MTDHADTIRRDDFPNATPRPWYFDGWDIFTHASSGGPNGDGHRLVVPLSHLNETWHPSQQVKEDDARLIVQAVNERDALLAERQQAQEEADSLRLELEAEKHNHRKDVEYLARERDEWKQSAQKAEASPKVTHNPPLWPRKHWQTCPICGCKVLVPHGFYDFPGVQVYPATGTNPERCRSCGGRGVL